MTRIMTAAAKFVAAMCTAAESPRVLAMLWRWRAAKRMLAAFLLASVAVAAGCKCKPPQKAQPQQAVAQEPALSNPSSTPQAEEKGTARDGRKELDELLSLQ